MLSGGNAMLKNIVYTFIGILIGGIIGRLLMRFIKAPDWAFNWYWDYKSVLTFTLLDIIIFMLPFAIYILLIKGFKISILSLNGIEYAIIGLLFTLCDVVISSYMFPALIKFAKYANSVFINYTVNAFIIVFLFFIILALFKMVKKLFYGIY
jgi:hypothetical protein